MGSEIFQSLTLTPASRQHLENHENFVIFGGFASLQMTSWSMPKPQDDVELKSPVLESKDSDETPETSAEPEAESEPVKEDEVKPEPESEPEVEPESEPKAEPESEPESEPKSEPEAEPETSSEPEPESESEPEPESESESEPEQESESEPEPESESEPESEPYPESDNRDPKAAAQPVTKLRSNSAASSVGQTLVLSLIAVSGAALL